MEKAGVPAFEPIQDSRFYFNYHHTAADTLDKIVPKELAENSAIVAVWAYAMANSYTGSGLGETWSNHMQRSGFVGTFAVPTE